MSLTLDIPEDVAKLIESYASEHAENRAGEDRNAARDAATLATAKLAFLWDSAEEDAAWADL